MRDEPSVEKSDLCRWAFGLLFAGLFSVAFSLPLGRTLVGISFILLVTDCIRLRYLPRFPCVAWCWFAFFVIALLASAFGVNPARSFGKIDKLLWFLAIPLTASLVQDWQRLRSLLWAIAAGCGVLSLEILTVRPLAAWLAMREAVTAGEVGDYVWELTDLGSMTDGQTLMVGIVAMIGLLASRSVTQKASKKATLWSYALLLVLVLAVIINLKRGSWICTFGIVGIFVASRLKVRHLAMLAVVAVGILLLPPVWGRFSALRQELDASRGGRIVMWTRIAPPLVKAHPFGIGYRALTEAIMLEVAAEEGIHVERGRNHLHSNPVQVLVALGWLGLAVYLVWMAGGIVSGVRLLKTAPRGSPERTMALALLLMLSGLLLNGLVEYNLSDGELVILYGVLLGVLGAGMGRSAATAAPSHSSE
jgi:hypothetical protein